jgi:hypothetical protein
METIHFQRKQIGAQKYQDIKLFQHEQMLTIYLATAIKPIHTNTNTIQQTNTLQHDR